MQHNEARRCIHQGNIIPSLLLIASCEQIYLTTLHVPVAAALSSPNVPTFFPRVYTRIYIAER